MKFIISLTVILLFGFAAANAQQCRFELSGGKESATYFEAIEWYKNLDKRSPLVKVMEMGSTDAGYPLHLVLVSSDAIFDIAKWKAQKKVVVLINNGIHPGEPDGIDASMLLVRDIVAKKIILPGNVAVAFIPVYNIGGCLNRGSSSRVNQNGPLQYGFRGNSQNLDLNRDFTKCDSREARSFTEIFHMLDPDILMDNHVSDGADYQHTMTLLTTQYNKLGDGLGQWLKQTFEPKLYKGMTAKGWNMVPYVNFETTDFEKGMEMFYDPPRYSSGYAALFSTIAFVPETHMLKPFKDRVLSTYALMQTMIEEAGSNALALLAERNKAKAAVQNAGSFALSWQADTIKNSVISFMGYGQDFKTSDVTGLKRMFYNHDKPYTKQVRFFNAFNQVNIVAKPAAYIVPQGWYEVIDRLKLNGVKLRYLLHDTIIDVEAYHIDDYKSYPRAYEKHHKNSAVKVSLSRQKIKFLKGDWLIPMDQAANRYIIEMLEPTGDDSFFAWNFFDAILQQKEGYSDYRWEDIAGEFLKKDPVLQKKLQDRRSADTAFAKNVASQLDFVYKNSAYYEPAHLRYPVFRIVQ